MNNFQQLCTQNSKPYTFSSKVPIQTNPSITILGSLQAGKTDISILQSNEAEETLRKYKPFIQGPSRPSFKSRFSQPGKSLNKTKGGAL
jgi:hypothetical protein